MDIKELITSPITSEKVEEKGQNLYKTGKIFAAVGLFGIALALIVFLISEMLYPGTGLWPFIFDVASGYEFVYIFVVPAYLGILLGVISPFLYFGGMNLYTQGRIAVNTEKDKE